MRNPSSFEHIETRVTPVSGTRQTIYMRFRAENGFGGMNDGIATGDITHSSCALIESTIEIAS